MSDTDKDDAANPEIPAAKVAPPPAPPKPAAKTVVGIGAAAAKPAPPLPSGAIAAARPSTTATATFAKPPKADAPPPTAAATAAPKAPGAAPALAPKPPATAAPASAPVRQGGAIPMAPASTAARPNVATPIASPPRVRSVAAAPPTTASAPVAAPKAGSLFDLDAPVRPTLERSLEGSSTPVAEPPRSSLFDLDAPLPQQAPAQRALAPRPAAARPAANPLDAAPTPSRAPLLEPQPKAVPAPSPPSVPAAETPLVAGPEAEAAAAAAAADGSLPPTAASLDAPPGDGPSMFEEDSSLYEVEALRTRPSAARSTAEILVSALGQPELVGLRPAEPAAAVEVHHEGSFDTTLTVPRPTDTLEDRRARLGARLKTLRSAFKVLGFLDITDDERKETLGMFAEYEARLKAAAGPEDAATAKRDLAALHRTLPKEALDELERAAAKLEDKLLALDEYVPRDKFRARITKEKHAPKLLLRYARLLASRRFHVGYRRDRFEHLVNELLTSTTSDGRMRILPRDKARPVVLQLLTGVPASPAESDRDEAVAYLRESLDRLAGIATQEDFFDSGFFLDVHGYKISMRDQATSPEFLYLSIALNVQIHNRIEDWIEEIERGRKGNQLTQDGPPREFLKGKLLAQEDAVQSVFAGYRHPKERPMQTLASKAQQQEAKDAGKKDAGKREAARREAAKKKAGKANSGAQTLQEISKRERLKFAVLSVLAVTSFSYVLISTEIVTVETATSDRLLTPEETEKLSPLLEFVAQTDSGRRITGRVKEVAWQKLNTRERQDAADKLRKNMMAAQIRSAELLVYKAPAIRIDAGAITYIQPKP